MLITGKLHSRVENCSFQISIQTLDFAGVRIFYWHDRSWIASRGAEGGRGAIAGWSLMLFLADDGTPSIDQYRRRWRARNGGKWLGERATGSATPTREAQWPIGSRMVGRGIAVPSPIGHCWTIGRRRGQMGA